MNGPRENALGLLEKAAHDLIAAEATLATGQALDTVCFHAQQAAEKSLKAVLALRDVVYPRTHDLGELTAMAKPHCQGLAELEDALASLSPYAVEIRYDSGLDPAVEEAELALKSARRIHDVVKQLLKS
jgi:HEPN domain-containing protein